LPGTVNGCALATATDLTAQSAVTITFTDFVYSPSCLVVEAGTGVTFQGMFTPHPLVGGTVAGFVTTPDGPSNPITPTSAGTSQAFTMSAIGGYGFYCDTHAVPPLDMKGAIFVVAAATTTSTSTTTSTTLPAVNACDPATATDLTAQSAVTVNFANFAYSPSCLRVRAGAQVTFQGTFTLHPLVGGIASDQTKAPDPSSPIPATSSGTSTAVTLPVPGAYGFYCDVHGVAPTNMKGAVFVVAE
jgi:plastocyanin